MKLLKRFIRQAYIDIFGGNEFDTMNGGDK